MKKTIIISITAIICTILVCFTLLHISKSKMLLNNNYNRYSISGNGTFGDRYILKDLKTGNVYIEETDNNGNSYWKLDISFKK